MNFLSHYYFNRFLDDELFVVGSVLPDLVRNADSSIKIHPEKDPVLQYKNTQAVWAGWNQHIQIDSYFHQSVFFKDHTSALRKELTIILTNTPVKSFFLAHISLELLIDYLLIKHNKVQIPAFYMQLEKDVMGEITSFLLLTGKVSPVQISRFSRFYHMFCQHAYLHSYKNISGICYAAVQICKRIWPSNPVTEDQENHICVLYEQYARIMDTSYTQILDEIQLKLNGTEQQPAMD